MRICLLLEELKYNNIYENRNIIEILNIWRKCLDKSKISVF